MICTFCGTDNPPTNRFCGMCGVRLERRKADRRVNPGATTKCGACGHVNETGYKFCGMCGVRIDRRVGERRGAADKSRATSAINVQSPSPESRTVSAPRQSEYARASVPAVARTPVLEREHHYTDSIFEESRSAHSGVSGPSFLGLNEPQGEGEYLLEEEKSSRRGLRALLLLVILAAIVGLIVVQWRSSLHANPKPFEQPNPEPARVPQGKNQLPAIMKTPQIVAAVHKLQTGAAAVAKNPPAQVSKEGPDSSLTKADKTARKAGPAEIAENDPPAKTADTPPDVKTKPSMALVKAERYLQGRGVPQNCEQGLMYLKAATEENDPKAAVEMGALYSIGLCVQQDRVQAYKWFSSARDLEPGNRWIDKNMSQLWAQMTSEERRRARGTL
jgi:hypothetical protein